MLQIFNTSQCHKYLQTFRVIRGPGGHLFKELPAFESTGVKSGLIAIYFMADAKGEAWLERSFGWLNYINKPRHTGGKRQRKS